jgi:hypothetical protein
MAASHPNAAISDTFGDALDAVTPAPAFVSCSRDPSLRRLAPAS